MASTSASRVGSGRLAGSPNPPLPIPGDAVPTELTPAGRERRGRRAVLFHPQIAGLVPKHRPSQLPNRPHRLRELRDTPGVPLKLRDVDVPYQTLNTFHVVHCFTAPHLRFRRRGSYPRFAGFGFHRERRGKGVAGFNRFRRSGFRPGRVLLDRATLPGRGGRLTRRRFRARPSRSRKRVPAALAISS